MKARGPEIRAGYTDVAYLPATAIHDLQQIREEYDPEKLQELADRIELTDAGFDLVHPVTVAVFDDPAMIEQFLRDHARFYQYEFDAASLEQIPQMNGSWHIRVSGHRRGRALLLKCQQLGLDASQLQVACTLQHNPTFDEARHSQIVENTSDHIKESEDAREVYREYCYRFCEEPSIVLDRSVELERYKEIAAYMGYRVDKVESRLLYATMPADITQHHAKGLSYTNIVQLAKLRRAWGRQRDIDGNYICTPEAADYNMRVFFEQCLLRVLRTGRTAVATTMLDAKLREIKAEATYMTGELFVIDTMAEQRRSRRQVRRGIGEAATLALQAGLSSPDAEERKATAAQIQGLYARLQQLTEANRTYDEAEGAQGRLL